MSGGITFLQPWDTESDDSFSSNRAYNIGEYIQVAWSGNCTNGQMVLTQANAPGDGTGGPAVILADGITGVGSDNIWGWTVTYDALVPADAYLGVYYFTLRDNYTHNANAHFFNITDTQSSLTSSIISSIISSTASSTTMQTTSSSAPAAIITPPQTRPATIGIQAGDVAGIAIGAAVVAFLLAGAMFCIWKRKRRPSAVGNLSMTEDGSEKHHEADGAGIYEVPATARIHEVPGGGQHHEVPGSYYYQQGRRTGS